MKNVFSVALTLLLCACVTNPPVPVSAVSVSPPAPAESKAPESSAFKSQRVITPVEIIEKDQLRVSYSLKVIPDETGYLVQISMVFRNKKDKSISLSPKITLSDSKDTALKAYSKKSFLKLVSRKPAAAKSGGAVVNRIAAEEKIKWANAYWLKEHFTIPANGIEIGELVYHCASINLPLKLTVNSAGQSFVFTIIDTTAG